MKKWILGGVGIVVLAAAAFWAYDNRNAYLPYDLKSSEDVELAEYPQQVYWGDTHLHSENSPDAFGFGNRLSAEAALRYARGEEVTSTMGVKSQLARPLDFLVIADHSDGLGFTKRLADAPNFMLPNDILKRWNRMLNESPEKSAEAMNEMIDMAGDPEVNRDVADPADLEKETRKIWDSHVRTVEDYYEPGKFTAFLGFEFTPMPDGNNLHRVVMFRDGPDKAGTITPLPATLAPEPHQLWDYMENYEEKTEGRVLAIPHNSNVSNGLMFQMTGPTGKPMTAAEAKRRTLREPVVEVTQIKGDSEAHPFLSPNDEFAGYGTLGWDKANLNAKQDTTPDMYAGSYVREALKRGLAIQQRTGENPYKFGLIGSTDSHTSFATADEDNFFGKHTGNEPTKEGRDRVTSAMNLGSRLGRFNWHYLSSGYAAVWAKANTREEIFDAFTRREVYATTGPRMTVRLFGGWDFTEEDFAKDWVKAGYARGVPMGGDLNAGEGTAPTFLVLALKDADGANLDRVQMVKGWVDGSGNLQEKVFNIVWSDAEKRQLSGGKLPDVGNSVNLKTAEYENSIGASELKTMWRDPEFDPKQQAFYYVRVIEIPTPRWVLYDAVRYKLNLSEEIPLVSQERAYTSPIWYNPS